MQTVFICYRGAMWDSRLSRLVSTVTLCLLPFPDLIRSSDTMTYTTYTWRISMQISALVGWTLYCLYRVKIIPTPQLTPRHNLANGLICQKTINPTTIKSRLGLFVTRGDARHMRLELKVIMLSSMNMINLVSSNEKLKQRSIYDMRRARAKIQTLLCRADIIIPSTAQFLCFTRKAVNH